MAFDINGPKTKKVLQALCGLAGLMLLVFGYTQMGNDLVDKSQRDLQTPAVIEQPVSPTTN